MRFSVDWIQDAPNRCPEERATVGALKLFLGEDNAFAFHDPAAHEVSEALTIAAVHLADGIAREWWRILGGRDCRHSLLPYRNGFVLPDFGFRFDGTDFEVSSKESEYGAEGLRFFLVAPEFVSRAALETALEDFVSCVESRLAQAGIKNSPLSIAWSRVTASRANPEEAAFCEAAGALRLDPYQIGDADALSIKRAGRLFHGEALIEFLAGVAERAVPSVPGVPGTIPDTVLSGLLEVARTPGEQARLPMLQDAGRNLSKRCGAGQARRRTAPATERPAACGKYSVRRTGPICNPSHRLRACSGTRISNPRRTTSASVRSYPGGTVRYGFT